MRKYVMMLVAIVVAMSLSSCKGDKGDPGLGMNWKIIDIPVHSADWQYTYDTDVQRQQMDNNYFYAAYNVPALDDFIFTEGSVHAYVVYSNGAEDVQRPLPYVTHKEAFVGDPAVRLFFTETYDFAYGVGWVEFNYRASDFAYEDAIPMDPEMRPTPKKFRLVLNW